MATARGGSGARAGRGRIAMLLFLLALALLALVGARAWNARRAETIVAEIPLLRAEPGPARRRPEDPGGMEVPFQDMTVFNSLEGGKAEPVVERLLPPPEEPLPRPHPDRPAPTVAAMPAPPPDVVPAAVSETDDGGGEVVIESQADSPEPGAAPPAPGDPGLPPAPIEQQAMLAPSAVRPPDPEAGFRVQLGSFRSPDEADAGWLEALARAPDLLSPINHFVMRADLGAEKGVYHRLQAGPLPSRDSAESLCGQLETAGLDCFVVAP